MLSKRSGSDRIYMVPPMFFSNFQIYFKNHMVNPMIFFKILNIEKFIWYPYKFLKILKKTYGTPYTFLQN